MQKKKRECCEYIAVNPRVDDVQHRIHFHFESLCVMDSHSWLKVVFNNMSYHIIVL